MLTACSARILRIFRGTSRHALTCLVGAVMLFAGSISEVSADFTWKTDAEDNYWTNPLNWVENAVPPTYGDFTHLFRFTSSDITTLYISNDKSVKGITFSGESDFIIRGGNPNPPGGGGGVIYLGTSGIVVNGGSQQFSAQVRPAVNQGTFPIVNNGTGTLTFSEMMANFGNKTTVVFDGPGTTTLTRIYRRNTDAQASIVKQGSGVTTILDGINSEAGSNAAGYMTGTTTIRAGTLRIDREHSLGGNPDAFNPAHLTLDGGTLQAFGTFAIDDSNRGITVTNNGGALEVVASRTLTIASTLAGNGPLTKSGNGRLELTNALNSFTGTTTIAAGTLALTGSALLPSETIDVGEGASFDVSGLAAEGLTLVNQTITGNGRVLGDLTAANGSTVSPGESPGHLLVEGDFNLAGGTLQAELGGSVQGSSTGYDWLEVTGTATLGGTVRLELVDGFVPALGETFQILTATSGITNSDLDGVTFDIAGPSTGGGWEASIVALSGGAEALQLTSVPEPGSLALWGVGLLGLLACIRRQRSC